LSNLCEPRPSFYDHTMLIDRDNFYLQSLSNICNVIHEIDLQKNIIRATAYASSLFFKIYIVPAEIIVVECTDDFWPEDTLSDDLKGTLLNKGAKFSIICSEENWQYRVDGITPSTLTTVVTEDTVFVVRKIDTLETTKMY
jgi:hypothetical protein